MTPRTLLKKKRRPGLPQAIGRQFRFPDVLLIRAATLGSIVSLPLLLMFI